MKKLILCFFSLMFISGCSSTKNYSNLEALERNYDTKILDSCGGSKVHLEKVAFGMKVHVTTHHKNMEHKLVKKVNFNHERPNLVNVINKMIKKSCRKVMHT